MAVIYNKDTGAYENVDSAGATNLLNTGTHEVPLISPEGIEGSAPLSDLPSLLEQGYTQPSSEILQKGLDSQRYGTTKEQIKTAIEGVAEASTFGLSTGAERALGVPAEDIAARRSENPVSHGVGQAIGLGLGMFTGSGEAMLLEKAGAKAASAIAAETAIGRIGSTAAKAAVENAIFQSGDEVSKMFASSPEQSVQTALTDIGLAALIGGGAGGVFGTVPELWKMGPGKKIAEVMDGMKAGSSGLAPEVKLAAGIEIPAEYEAALAGNPYAKRAIEVMNESPSMAGKQVQAATKELYDNVNGGIATALKRTPEDFDNLVHASEYEIGKSAKDSLVKSVEEKIAPIAKQYDKFEEQFKKAALSQNIKAEAMDSIVNKVNDMGIYKSGSEGQQKFINNIIKRIPLQENANDIKNFASLISDQAPFGSENYQLGKLVKTALQDLQEKSITEHLGATAPELLAEYNVTKQAYAQFKDTIGALNDRLHVGKGGGAQSFIQRLKDAAPEDIVKRLNPNGDVEMQALLEKEFPETSTLVKNQEINKLLKASPGKGDSLLDSRKLLRNFDRLSPEMKEYLAPGEAGLQLGALKGIVDAIPTTINPSGTARTHAALNPFRGVTAGGILGLMSGHGLAGAAIGRLMEEAPDAIRLGMLKFLASDAPTSAGGMNAIVKYAKNLIRSENKVNKAVDAVFTKGSDVIPMPDKHKIDKLRKIVEEASADPAMLMEVGGQTGHYAPDHAGAMGLTAARAVTYLERIRPNTEPLGTLNNKRVSSKAEEQNYTRALEIAQNPAIMLNYVKNGTLTQKDMMHMREMYPELMGRFQNKIFDRLIEVKESGARIPHQTKLSLSIFTGQPLTYSLQPQVMQSIQQTFAMHEQSRKPASNLDKLGKLGKMDLTGPQAREVRRTK